MAGKGTGMCGSGWEGDGDVWLGRGRGGVAVTLKGIVFLIFIQNEIKTNEIKIPVKK